MRKFWTLITGFFVLGQALLTKAPGMHIDASVPPLQAAALSWFGGVGTVISRQVVLARFYATYVAVPLFLITAFGRFLLLLGGTQFAALTAVLIKVGFGGRNRLDVLPTSRHFGQRTFGSLYSDVYSAFMFGRALGPVSIRFPFNAQQSNARRCLFLLAYW